MNGSLDPFDTLRFLEDTVDNVLVKSLCEILDNFKSRILARNVAKQDHTYTRLSLTRKKRGTTLTTYTLRKDHLT